MTERIIYKDNNGEGKPFRVVQYRAGPEYVVEHPVELSEAVDFIKELARNENISPASITHQVEIITMDSELLVLKIWFQGKEVSDMGYERIKYQFLSDGTNYDKESSIYRFRYKQIKIDEDLSEASESPVISDHNKLEGYDEDCLITDGSLVAQYINGEFRIESRNTEWH